MLTARLDCCIHEKILFCIKRSSLVTEQWPDFEWSSKDKTADRWLTRPNIRPWSANWNWIHMSGFWMIPDFGCPDFGCWLYFNTLCRRSWLTCTLLSLYFGVLPEEKSCCEHVVSYFREDPNSTGYISQIQKNQNFFSSGNQMVLR
jgi:hypothetical protein